ncbi:nucleotidyltransferase domain-containing protein [Micromonospora sp. DT62]|uniref:nucleotidyltransferase domain-containing protein n=1 Tax=Micromonospora sp. DT62 TaxID=3416521 RepID=UPI003CE97EF2
MSDLGTWEPETPRQVVDRFRRSDVRQPWWIAGGYAIELFAGRSLRPHGDIDVLILRRDQGMVHHVLPGWDIHAADPPGQLRPWRDGELLPEHVHDIWCREDPTSPWRLQFMIDNADGRHWHSRRHPAVTLPVDRLGRRTREGWPYLAPEVQLHYKAKPANQLAKDEIDFAAALPLLSQPACRWLDDALGTTLPDHHWRRALKTCTARPR